MKTLKFFTNNIYHIYNRGVDGRNIFEEDKDYLRFIHSLYDFNDKHYTLPYGRISKNIANFKTISRQLLVNILGFCLMPNHFHLVLQQLIDGGITKFMRKLGTGYTMYFNLKYKRSGALFQGKFKGIIVENDDYFLHLSRYIHLNPIGLIQPDWKQEGIKDWYNVEHFLKAYRWSSFLDYIGIKNFPSITQRDFLLKYFKDETSYKKFVESFLIEDISRIKDILLD